MLTLDENDVPNEARDHIGGVATDCESLWSGSCTVGGPSGLSGSTEDDLRASRRSRFSWAFRILSISLRRFSNAFVFFAMLLKLKLKGISFFVKAPEPAGGPG